MKQRNDIRKITNRFIWIFIAVVAIGAYSITQVIIIQNFSGDIVTPNDIYKNSKLKAIRGSILARDGRPLAISVPYYLIRMDCSTVKDSLFRADIDQLSKNLALLFKNKTSNAYKQELIKARNKGNRYKLIGNRSIDFVDLEKLKRFPIFKKGQYQGGLIVIQTTKRQNPYEGLAYRTIGYINEVGTGVGIENSFDYKLRGTPGSQKIHRQLGGEWIPVSGERIILAKDGYDIQTTLDIDIQESAEEALIQQLSQDNIFEGGTAIVMDVKTGAIRAIANMKRMGNGKFDESYNYAIMDATEPGSTIKLASLICLLEDGYANLKTTTNTGRGQWRYANIPFSDSKIGGHGNISLQKGFESSSNICFAKLITKHYHKQEDKFVSRLHNMKIGEKFNLDIEGEGRASITSPKDKLWSKVTLPMLSIGYGLLLTPLHTLAFYNAIANGGKMMKPYFVENFQKYGIVETKFSPEVISGSICSKSTIKEVTKALIGVVEKGTASKYQDSRYSIAGKTGTARIAFDGKYIDAQGRRRHQASFAGFFPANDPKYSCVVVLYTGKTRSNFYGGTWATPVFKEIADKIYTSHPEWKSPIEAKGEKPKDHPNIAGGRTREGKILMKILPTKNKIEFREESWVNIKENKNKELQATPIIIKKGYIPDVNNMGLKDALYILENEGYAVYYNPGGKGRVKRQSPKPGTLLAKKARVTLELSNKL